nr:RNA-directed DNA polymerase, eukaryota [Tanacetum cinerariifolium]
MVTSAATISVDEDQFIKVGPQLELYESILHDHTQHLDALPPTLFEGYERDLRELYTRSGAVRDEIFLQGYRFRSLEREQERSTANCARRLWVRMGSGCGKSGECESGGKRGFTCLAGNCCTLYSVQCFKRRGDRDACYLIDSHIFDVSPNATRWNLNIPIKVNVFLWRLSLNKLPLRVNLDKKDIDVDTILCPICNDDVESVNHLFFTCDMAKDLWAMLARWWELDISFCSNMTKWFVWLDSLTISYKARVFFERVGGTLLWFI